MPDPSQHLYLSSPCCSNEHDALCLPAKRTHIFLTISPICPIFSMCIACRQVPHTSTHILLLIVLDLARTSAAAKCGCAHPKPYFYLAHILVRSTIPLVLMSQSSQHSTSTRSGMLDCACLLGGPEASCLKSVPKTAVAAPSDLFCCVALPCRRLAARGHVGVHQRGARRA